MDMPMSALRGLKIWDGTASDDSPKTAPNRKPPVNLIDRRPYVLSSDRTAPRITVCFRAALTKNDAYRINKIVSQIFTTVRVDSP